MELMELKLTPVQDKFYQSLLFSSLSLPRDKTFLDDLAILLSLEEMGIAYSHIRENIITFYISKEIKAEEDQRQQEIQKQREPPNIRTGSAIITYDNIEGIIVKYSSNSEIHLFRPLEDDYQTQKLIRGGKMDEIHQLYVKRYKNKSDLIIEKERIKALIPMIENFNG